MQSGPENDKNVKKTVSIATMVRVRPLIQDENGYKESIKCLDEVRDFVNIENFVNFPFIDQEKGKIVEPF